VPADHPTPVADDRAVIDRIVDGTTAVLLIGPEETEKHVAVDDLPEGTAEGDWLVLDVDQDPFEIVGLDTDLTDARRAAIDEKLDRIRQRQTGNRFDHR
jgi:hypothetical protein